MIILDHFTMDLKREKPLRLGVPYLSIGKLLVPWLPAAPDLT